MMDEEQLKSAAIYLKCGEYDGTHIMTGYLACRHLIEAQKQLAEKDAEIASLKREFVTLRRTARRFAAARTNVRCQRAAARNCAPADRRQPRRHRSGS